MVSIKLNKYYICIIMKIIDLDNIKLNKNDINQIEDLELKIIEYLNSGSYGDVYVCLLNDKKCVLKMSNNEDPILLKKRYKELKKKIEGKIIKIYCSGRILNDHKYKYYCIMKYGGSNLKKYIYEPEIDINIILKKMYEMVNIIKDNKVLIPDLKLSNLTFHNNELYLIDYFIECESYNPCRDCKIIRTYSTFDLSSGIFYDESYNYSYIYVLFGFCLIELLCYRGLNSIHKEMKKKYGDIDFKKFILLIQITSYKFFNLKEKYPDEYLINLSKKNSSRFYGDFLNHIEVLDQYKNIISTEDFKELLNNILIPIPTERKIDNKIFK